MPMLPSAQATPVMKKTPVNAGTPNNALTAATQNISGSSPSPNPTPAAILAESAKTSVSNMLGKRPLPLDASNEATASKAQKTGATPQTPVVKSQVFGQPTPLTGLAFPTPVSVTGPAQAPSSSAGSPFRQHQARPNPASSSSNSCANKQQGGSYVSPVSSLQPRSPNHL